MSKSNLNWEARPIEKYAENWWREHGFDAKLIKRYIHKSVYEVSKLGLFMEHEIPDTVTDFEAYMELFEQSWDIFVKLQLLR